MITVSLSIVAAIAISFIVWLFICAVVAMIMFGDDNAFVVGPVLATTIVFLYWVISLGAIRFIE